MLKRNQLIAFTSFFVLYEISTYMSNDMVMPAMLEIVKQFNSSVSNISLSLTLYVVGGSVLQIFLGPLCDRFGKRNILLLGNLGFLFATILIPFSTTMTMFLAARFFQGMGLCFIFIGYATVHEIFNDKQAIKLISILANITIFAPLLGPLIGGAIISISHWTYVFILSGTMGLIAFIGLFKFMPESSNKHTIAGPLRLGMIVKTYMDIFRQLNFNVGVWTSGIAAVPVLAWIGLSPVIIMSTLKLDFTHYIIYQAVVFSGIALGNFIIQFIAGRIRFSSLIKLGSVLSCTGLVISGFTNNVNLFVISMMLYALGFGLFNGSLIRIALVSTGKSQSFSAAAMSLITCVGLGGGLEVYNLVCEYIGGYSITTFGLLNLIIAILVLVGSFIFAKLNQNLDWRD